MSSRLDEAWEKAAECAARAEETVDARSRALFRKLRDSWIQVANNLELSEGSRARTGRDKIAS